MLLNLTLAHNLLWDPTSHYESIQKNVKEYVLAKKEKKELLVVFLRLCLSLLKKYINLYLQMNKLLITVIGLVAFVVSNKCHTLKV